ncbi:MAG: hypothetical protein LAP86_34250 [Acidobacteriia bacterium]|nr:hypothetical protein [Terriglobia bacterium]
MSELLTVRDVATILKCGEDAVVRRFAKMTGVIDLGKPETRSRRRYRVLRIPKTVVEQYLTTKSGRPVQIEVPPRAERRRKSATWEKRAILNLAKAALQNECQDRKAYHRIADRARLLTAHVPEDRWSEIVWFDDED